MEIKNRTVEEVAVEIENLIEKLNPNQPYSVDALRADVDKVEVEALLKLLHIRSQLMDKFKVVFNVVDAIETSVKAKRLPAGSYGLTNPLKVAATKNTVYDMKGILNVLKEKFEDIEPYVIPDIKNSTVDEIINSQPQLVSTVRGSNRHTFK